MELIIIIALTLLLVPLVFLTTGALRIALGVLSLFFFPGYALLAVLFPKKTNLTGLERVALSFVLSFAIVTLIALILNYTPWGIRLEPIFITMSVFNLAASVSALLRRRNLLETERFEVRFPIKMRRWHRRGKLDNTISIILLLAILGTIGTLVYVVSSPRAGEAYTNFYILGSEGMAADYPKELVLGEPVEVTIGIANHERQYTSYNVEVNIDGEKVQEIGPINLANEEESQTTLTLVPTKAGKAEKVAFLLYKVDGSEPYLTLYLWLNVKET
jgi:uncharacterized membrane protein